MTFLQHQLSISLPCIQTFIVDGLSPELLGMDAKASYHWAHLDTTLYHANLLQRASNHLCAFVHADSSTGNGLLTCSVQWSCAQSKLYTFIVPASVTNSKKPSLHCVYPLALQISIRHSSPVFSLILVCLPIQTVSPVCSPGFLGLASFPILGFTDDIN